MKRYLCLYTYSLSLLLHVLATAFASNRFSCWMGRIDHAETLSLRRCQDPASCRLPPLHHLLDLRVPEELLRAFLHVLQLPLFVRLVSLSPTRLGEVSSYDRLQTPSVP